MKEMNFGDIQYPALEDFQPYTYEDNHPEDHTMHHGWRYEVPEAGEVAFMIEYVEARPDLDEPGGYVWCFQDPNGYSREDLSGGFDSIQEAYDNMKSRFDLETGRTEIFTMAIPNLDGNLVHYAYSSLENCLEVAANALDAHGDAAKSFEVSIHRNGQPFATLIHGDAGWQLNNLSTHAKERDAPDTLDSAMKEVRDKRASKEEIHANKPKRPRELER